VHPPKIKTIKMGCKKVYSPFFQGLII